MKYCYDLALCPLLRLSHNRRPRHVTYKMDEYRYTISPVSFPRERVQKLEFCEIYRQIRWNFVNFVYLCIINELQ